MDVLSPVNKMLGTSSSSGLSTLLSSWDKRGFVKGKKKPVLCIH